MADLFDPFFLAVPAKAAVLALLSAAPRAGHTFAAATISRLLTAMLAAAGIGRVCAELAAPGVALTERAQVIKLLVSLPDRVANMNAGVVECAETLVRAPEMPPRALPPRTLAHLHLYPLHRSLAPCLPRRPPPAAARRRASPAVPAGLLLAFPPVVAGSVSVRVATATTPGDCILLPG